MSQNPCKKTTLPDLGKGSKPLWGNAFIVSCFFLGSFGEDSPRKFMTNTGLVSDGYLVQQFFSAPSNNLR
jgi:hypothetical protein